MEKRDADISNSEVMWVSLHYTDLVGRLHELVVPYDLYARNSEFTMDGSSADIIEINSSDLRLSPDPRTFAVIPWDRRRGRVFCSIGIDGMPFWGDSRAVARRASEYVSAQNLREVIGVEVEFFIHKVAYNVTPSELYVRVELNEKYPNGVLGVRVGYEVPSYSDLISKVRFEIIEYLKDMEKTPPTNHHEVAPNQVEVTTPPGKAVDVADSIMTIKYVARYTASKYGLIANFMPKPVYGDNGSGMHTHVSLWNNGCNMFYDANDKHGISQICRYFIGGLIEHGRSLSAIVSPTTNSYKRLVAGYEAPIYLTWGIANRSVAIRIPKTCTHRRVRVEFRPPDPATNPYLALAAILMAGLDGVRKKIDPGEPTSENVYTMSEWKIKESGIKVLPRSLDEALDELESDNEYLKPVFPKELIERYIDVKRKEVKIVNMYPTPTEFMTYIMY
ncbi:MAG: type I glutamate--ammonia ligase [Desulfurococcales archaeon]|nr:type I glutamate--ammonia ligase [Desulfurococcales archaeon]